MTDFFENLVKLDLQDIIDRHLKVQVDAPWPAEAEYLESSGLKDAKRVLDIGTGNGHFLLRLAERHPDKKFIGAEVSESLASSAHDAIKKSGLDNIEVINELCPTDKITGEFDFAFARFALYATKNKDELLNWTYSVLSPGGRAAMIEFDIDLTRTEPPIPSWDKYARAIKDMKDSRGLDLMPKDSLVDMLSKAGFRDVVIEEKGGFSSNSLQPENFRNYWMSDSITIHKISPDIFTSDDCKQFYEFVEKIVDSGDGALFAPIIVASGKK